MGGGGGGGGPDMRALQQQLALMAAELPEGSRQRPVFDRLRCALRCAVPAVPIIRWRFIQMHTNPKTKNQNPSVGQIRCPPTEKQNIQSPCIFTPTQQNFFGSIMSDLFTK
jgi:hypothetical protein